MATIDESVFVRAPPDAVWEVVSDLDSEPMFWKGTKEVRNISKSGNTVRREITIAFRDKKCVQDVTIHPRDRIEAKFIRGVIDGSKDVFIAPEEDGTLLRAVWNVRLTGMMGMFGGMVSGHIKKGTKQALESIKEEVESRRLR